MNLENKLIHWPTRLIKQSIHNARGRFSTQYVCCSSCPCVCHSIQADILNETESLQSLGHLNWTICIPLNPFCSNDFPSISLSYWEANSYPRRSIMGKGNSSNFKTERDKGFSVPQAFKLDHLHIFKPILF